MANGFSTRWSLTGTGSVNIDKYSYTHYHFINDMQELESILVLLLDHIQSIFTFTSLEVATTNLSVSQLIEKLHSCSLLIYSFRCSSAFLYTLFLALTIQANTELSLLYLTMNPDLWPWSLLLTYIAPMWISITNILVKGPLVNIYCTDTHTSIHTGQLLRFLQDLGQLISSHPKRELYNGHRIVHYHRSLSQRDL